MAPKHPNRVQITLPDGIVHLTDTGDHDIHIDDAGRLTVFECTQPRDTGGIVAAYTAGQWLNAVVQKSSG